VTFLPSIQFVFLNKKNHPTNKKSHPDFASGFVFGAKLKKKSKKKRKKEQAIKNQLQFFVIFYVI